MALASLLSGQQKAVFSAFPRGNRWTVPLVILWPGRHWAILRSPTTEPGRRGWKWRLGSLLSAPHFFVYTIPASLNQPSTTICPIPLRAFRSLILEIGGGWDTPQIRG